METLQSFEWLDLPADLQKWFVETNDTSVHNGTYIHWYQNHDYLPEDGEAFQMAEKMNEWLFSQGMTASPSYLYKVLIHVWW